MHIFFGDGYLGNQLFQYSFIKSYLKPKILLTTNFSALIEFIEKDNKIKIFNLKNRSLIFFFRRIFIYILKLFSFVRLINSVQLKTQRYMGTIIESENIIIKKGIFPITFIFPHFFQNCKFHLKKNKNKIRIKKKYLKNATRYLSSVSKNTSNIIFFHLRLGQQIRHQYHTKNEKNDVSKFTIFGKKGTKLPKKYFLDEFHIFYKKFPNFKYLVISDNIELAKKIFIKKKNIFFSNQNLYEDLAIISKCKYGVLSNSSFSWWGYYFMKNPKLVIAPKYWLGWKSKIEFPLGITPRYVKTIKIK